jgi:hypothetical protein
MKPPPTHALSLALLICALTACATPFPPEEVDQFLNETIDAAEAQESAGRPLEALELIEAVLRVDPQYRDALELKARIGDDPAAEYLRENPTLGSNVARRPSVERSLAARAALYLPDRILDLLDVVSIDLHGPGGLYANIHLTRAAQLGGGGRSTVGVGLHERRSIGGLAQVETGIMVPGATSAAYLGAALGTSGTRLTRDEGTGPAQQPTDPVYQTFRDYWAIGFDATYFFVGTDVDIHPVQLWDWVAGFAGVDFLHDDFARTRGLELSFDDKAMIRRIYRVLSSVETLSRYADYARKRSS